MLMFHGVYLWPGLVLLVDSFRYLWYMRLSKPDIHVESYSNMLYTWGTWVEPRFLSLCNGLIDPWYLNNWVFTCVTVMLWLCISLSVKPCGFKHFLINFDGPIMNLQVFCMHVLCIPYAFLIHFLCTFLKVHKKCTSNACTLNQSTCTSYALL